jgi:hypothetical protein
MQAEKDNTLLAKVAKENAQRCLVSYKNMVDPTKFVGGELLRIIPAEFDEKVHCLHLLDLGTMPDTPHAKEYSKNWSWM